MPEDLPRCEDLWFADGNVVLQAEETLFKVYQGLLSRESEVFRAMFSLPQPAEPPETYEGCPLVVLQDSAEDIERFLLTIFDYDFLTGCTSSHVYASLLAVATKYQAYRLRKRVMKPLLTVFPSQLALFGGLSRASLDVRLSKWEDKAAIANMARTCGANILLPVILLEGCFQPVENLLDGTVPLHLDNLTAILTGIPKLSSIARNDVWKDLFGPPCIPAADCRNVERCRTIRYSIMKDIERAENVFDPFYNPYRYLRPPVLGPWPGDEPARLCDHCGPILEYAGDNKAAAWEKLPIIFGLGSWEELRLAETHASAPCVS